MDDTTDSTLPSVPTEVSELDALRLENLHLKADAAAEKFARARAEWQAALVEVGRRYGFDPGAGEGFDYATRKIVRK